MASNPSYCPICGDDDGSPGVCHACEREQAAARALRCDPVTHVSTVQPRPMSGLAADLFDILRDAHRPIRFDT